MKEIRIADLVWDDFNEHHIWERHQLTRAQVEAVCYGEPGNIQVKKSYGNRFLIIAPGQDGKLYAVALGIEGENIYYPVSARRADKKERREYTQWKAGTSNE